MLSLERLDRMDLIASGGGLDGDYSMSSNSVRGSSVARQTAIINKDRAECLYLNIPLLDRVLRELGQLSPPKIGASLSFSVRYFNSYSLGIFGVPAQIIYRSIIARQGG